MCFEIDIHSTIHAVIAQFPNKKTVKKSRSTSSETTNPIPINKSNAVMLHAETDYDL